MSSFYRGEILQADELNGEFAKAVQRTGDTMAGTLVLAHDPVVALDAATKRYVDNILGNAANTFLPITGGTLEGALILNSDPVVPMQAATKQYVDDEVAAVEPAGVEVSDTPPDNPTNGDLWFDSVGTQLYIRYDDGTSAAWVVVTNQAATTPVVAGVASFNTRTGPVTLSSADVTTVLPPSSTTPSMDGAAAVGSGTTWARADHVHPVDTSRYATSNPSGYQTAAQVAAAIAPALNDVGRNLIHNAGFNVAQRGAGPWTTSGVLTLDRWRMWFASDTLSVSSTLASDADRTAIGDEAAYGVISSAFTGNAAAGSLSIIQQCIESVRRLAGKTVIVSFYAVGSSALKLGASLDQVFGNGGSPSATVNGTGQSVTLATTWARYSLTFTLPSAAGKTFGTAGDDSTQLSFWYSSGATNATRSGSVGVQSGTVRLWGVQLEIGSVATPLEKRDPVLELQQCQRFYQTGTIVLFGYGTTGAALGFSFTLVPMRALPTVTVPSNSNSNITGFAIPGLGAASLYPNGTVTATGTYGINCTYTASADL